MSTYEPVSDDLTGISWTDPAWTEPLNAYTVLHYFARSPFFDQNSNNAKAYRDNLDPSVPGVLSAMSPGIEYVVQEAQEPNLFLIKKQQRKTQPEGVTPLGYYYVLDKVIYQAPTLYAIMSSRMQRCLYNIRQGFLRLQKDLDPLKKVMKEEARHKLEEAEALSCSGAPTFMPLRKRPTLESSERWRRSDAIIMNALRRYPVPKLPPEAEQQHHAYVPEAPPAQEDVSVKKEQTS